MPGVLVGHASDRENLTGCTAVLFESPAVVGVDVRGSSPGTRETDVLDPVGRVTETHGLLLTGGSAFGLDAAGGVVRYLEESGVGYDVRVARVPIVPAAVLFDLALGSPNARPGPEMGYEAASNAASGAFQQGGVGAGTGATVGKVRGMEWAMKSGVGSVSLIGDDGLVVAALAAVNAFGEVRYAAGRVIAGPRREDGALGGTLELLRGALDHLRWGENTTLGVVTTNARLSRPQATKVARMAHDGFARVIEPVHTSVDGDLIFAASIGAREAPIDVVGAWGARAMQEAVVRAVMEAAGLPGLPSASEL